MLTAKRLRKLLDYNADTGVFVWRVSNSPRAVAGSIAGTRRPEGYLTICIDGKDYRAHRLAWLHHFGEWPPSLDHKNGDNSHNLIENLRPATKSQNAANRGKTCNNTSGFKGVWWRRRYRKWQATIGVNGKRFYLGMFDTPEAAHAAYAAAAQRLHGEFARVA